MNQDDTQAFLLKRRRATSGSLAVVNEKLVIVSQKGRSVWSLDARSLHNFQAYDVQKGPFEGLQIRGCQYHSVGIICPP